MYSCFNKNYLYRQADQLKSIMRLVWEQHIYWTKMTINSIAYSLPDEKLVTDRLLRNATDMGNILKPFYGNAIGEQYSSLIKDHLVIAAELVKAAKANNQQAAMDAEKKWYRNGEQIAEFLSTINPYISRAEFRKMFFEHLANTKMEAVYTLQHNVNASIDIFDIMELQALQMADTITFAILNQFSQGHYV